MVVKFTPSFCFELIREWWIGWLICARRLLGILLTLNFVLFWMLPIFVQGLLFRFGLNRVFRPAYAVVDGSLALRRFAAKFIYRRQIHVDYFASALCLVLIMGSAIIGLFSWQIHFDSLPWWLVVGYYFLWVGPGARCLATAYTLAHREGHMSGGRMYQPWIGDRTGNLFENWFCLFYGIVPYNYSTSHILLHHRLDCGKGDPMYLWDLDRTKPSDMMLYQWRVFRYMSGISSVIELRREWGVNPSVEQAYERLRRGMLIFWLWVPAGILGLLIGTGSSVMSALWFLFFVYLQPIFAMSTFNALINVGQHGFLETENGRLVNHVTSTTILDGYDDSFGEDYHVAHHHFPNIDHDGLGEHVAHERAEWARCDGALFEKTSIVEMSLLIQFRQIGRLVKKHFVNLNEIHGEEWYSALYERRARRREMSYKDYEFHYLPKLRERVRELVRSGACTDENRAYIFQAHHNLKHVLACIAGNKDGNTAVDESSSIG